MWEQSQVYFFLLFGLFAKRSLVRFSPYFLYLYLSSTLSLDSFVELFQSSDGYFRTLSTLVVTQSLSDRVT